VCVVARGAQLDVIRREGIRIEAKDGSFHARMPASDDPFELGVQDAVLVTVKAPSLPSVAAGIAPLLGPQTAVIFAMNGIPWWYFHGHGGEMEGQHLARIDPDQRLLTEVGRKRTVGAVVYSACSVLSPGVIHIENARNRLIIGRPDGAVDAGLDDLAAIMVKGGLEAEVTPRIRDAVWAKLALNMTTGPLTLLTASAMKDVITTPANVRAALSMVQEAATIARAFDCDPGDVEAGLSRVSGSAHKPSILQDLEMGRPMEIDALYRVPLELARMKSMETPMLDLMIGLVIQRARAAGLYAD
jgi:2-dehydropantoate 2-reductase